MKQQKPTQKIRNKSRVYSSQQFKQQYCKKFVLDSFDITFLLEQQQKKNTSQNKQQTGLKSIYRLQSKIDSQFIIKNIFQKYSSNQLHIYQQDFDCFLSQLNLQSLNFQKRFKLFHCIALGVKDMNDRLICHRYLSPATISITFIGKSDIIAKINTFDYCEQLQNKKALTSSSVQKNQYSSPQIKYYRPHGLSSDVWSLGAILNYLLYGTIDNIWEDEGVIKIQVLQNTPDWLLQFLKSMLHYNPLKRHSIGIVLEIINSSLKCLSSLTKFIPISSGKRKFFKIQSKLKLEQSQ